MKIEIPKNTLKAYFRARREFLDAREARDEVKTRWERALDANLEKVELSVSLNGAHKLNAPEDFKAVDRDYTAALQKMNIKHAELERARGNLLDAIKKYEKDFL